MYDYMQTSRVSCISLTVQRSNLLNSYGIESNEHSLT
jgi:hypothetical protein